MSRSSKKAARQTWQKHKIRLFFIGHWRFVDWCEAVKQEEVKTDSRGAGPRPGDKLRSVGTAMQRASEEFQAEC